MDSSMSKLQTERDALLAQLHDVGRELLATRVERDAARAESERLRAQQRDSALALGRAETERHVYRHQANRYRWRTRTLYRELFGEGKPCPPPRVMPQELVARFSMNGAVELASSYVDATVPSNWPLIYTDAEIDAYLQIIRTNLSRLDSVGPEEWCIYGWLDRWVCDAILKYPIADRSVVNLGSISPWYEAMFIHFGARPVTIDYNRILLRTERMGFMTIDEWEERRTLFDVGFSISSFEHDGLGAYGDPIDPDGDLKAMAKMKERIKPGGLLFLAVPTGKDKVVFNQARIYGRVRLPLLMQGWEWIDQFGFDERLYDGNGGAQPVYVLRNA